LRLSSLLKVLKALGVNPTEFFDGIEIRSIQGE
jgi:hypothetical protein